jgi:hypothetical protein
MHFQNGSRTSHSKGMLDEGFIRQPFPARVFSTHHHSTRRIHSFLQWFWQARLKRSTTRSVKPGSREFAGRADAINSHPERPHPLKICTSFYARCAMTTTVMHSQGSSKTGYDCRLA